MMKEKNDAAMHRAIEIREEFQQSGEFDLQRYHEALSRELKPYFNEVPYTEFVSNILQRVDDMMTRERPSVQSDLPGVVWDIAGEYKLGFGRRVHKSKALIEHADEVLANDEKNIANVMRASARKHEEIASLRPYWKQGMTKEEAIEGYRRANPEANAS